MFEPLDDDIVARPGEVGGAGNWFWVLLALMIGVRLAVWAIVGI